MQPLYVYALVDWDTGDVRVDIATDVAYMLKWRRRDDQPVHPGGTVGRWALARVERFGSLDRARVRGRQLQHWPAAWYRRWLDLQQIPTHGFAELVHKASKDGVIPDIYLAAMDGTAAPDTDRLPRRESWFDGNRPA